MRELSDENIQKMVDEKEAEKKKGKLLKMLERNGFEIEDTPDGVDAIYDPGAIKEE